jgi:hypothetical protein
MRKAIAMSVEHPFDLALASLDNVSRAIIDFMYGTPQRVTYTYGFALGLAVLSGILHVAGAGSMVCSGDTLGQSL